MHNSFVADGGTYHDIAVGHQPWFAGKRGLKTSATDPTTAPTGGVIATVNDLALYCKMMLNGDDDIVSAESKRLMMQPGSPLSPYYGLGWHLNRSNGTAYHSGLTPGIETLAVLSLEDKKAFVGMTNSNSGMGFGTNTKLLYSTSAEALGYDVPDYGTEWGIRSLYLTFLFLPIVFAIAILRVCFIPSGLLSKSGLSGQLSLWVPLPIMIVLAWFSVYLLPRLFGVSLFAFWDYQPDFVVLLCATAFFGIAWALLRLGVYFLRRAQW